MADENTSNVSELETTQVANEDTKKEEVSEDVVSTQQYTKEQIDGMMANVRRKAEAAAEKRFSGIDVEKYRELVEREEKIELEKQKKKGEFDTILKQQAEKFGAKINTLTSELTKIKVDGALLSAASTAKAINPEQVVSLVRNQIRMSETGEVEVVDKNGTIRFDETGTPMTTDKLVAEFLQSNPHFVQAGVAGGGSKSNTTPNTNTSTVDINSLDLDDPEQRALYKEMRRKKYPNIQV